MGKDIGHMKQGRLLTLLFLAALVIFCCRKRRTNAGEGAEHEPADC